MRGKTKLNEPREYTQLPLSTTSCCNTAGGTLHRSLLTTPTYATVVIGILLFMCSAPVRSAPLNIADTPLFLTQTAAPLTMLVLGRDHKLYYEAYNDASDLDGDGVLDIGYKPSIDYYGYFDSYKCYSYSSGKFTPISTTANKKCAGAWSGDFLNYVTTSRIDALRKVLYGGLRSTDTNSSTILERAYIPQDAHSWGKEYTSVAVNGYNISEYTPLSLPSSGNRHLFANTTLNGSSEPRLRVAQNVNYRIWEWVSIERPVAGNRVLNGGSGPNISSSITDYTVRVEVCQPGLLEANCQVYPYGNYKPIGLLQEFGENNSMKFGLITGSYAKNLSGGVLRKNIAYINDEISSSDGTFTSTVGIIKTIDRLRVIGFDANYIHNANCGFIFSRDINEGECRLWGNPIAEMMYEAVRYFAGKATPTSAFTYSGGDDATLGLPQATWQNPYDTNNNPWCARPNLIVVSDINPSYDTDQIPGSAFASYSGDLSPTLNASELGQTIWNTEVGGSSQHFIGQSATSNDGAPTAKTVTSFGNIRGLAPEEPNKQGGYYAASVSYYGWLSDLNNVQGEQDLFTYAIALASPLPEIVIPVNGQTITLIPFAKSVGPSSGCVGSGINPAQGSFQPTNTIVDFYVESLGTNTGTFRINYEDAQQGADHDMDAIVTYTYTVNSDNTVTITLTSTYAAGCIIQHMGYVISGTTADGVYLEVRDFDTAAGSDVDYFLDTPPGQNPGGAWNDGAALPLTNTRIFTPSSSPAATLLRNPLWYAAKWGSFNDSNNNNLPDVSAEWDSDNDGNPDNYFLVNNALNLSAQLSEVLLAIIDRSSTASAATINSATLSSTTRIYQVVFNSNDWSGKLLSFPINTSTGAVITTGTATNGAEWDAATVISGQHYDTGREILTYKSSQQTGIALRWPNDVNNPSASELDTNQITALNTNPASGTQDGLGAERLAYIRGKTTLEQDNGGTFRNRSSLLGDIINSRALYVGPPAFPYSDTWPSGSPENSASYSTFRTTHANRTPVLYVGANDGMLHAINAQNGSELFAYVPNAAFAQLNQLTDPNYAHKYYVDGSPNSGDVFFNNAWHSVLVGNLNKGGQGIYALDVTSPQNIDESTASNAVLWEFTDNQDVDLGYTFSQPAIARLANGKWGAIFGNGYNNTEADGNISSTGNAVLFVVDIETGALIKKFNTGVGSSNDPLSTGRPNGLATPVVVDNNGDNIADYVYAGDLFGNLWKFDLTGSNANSWKIDFNGSPLFVAQYDASDITTRQPITSRPNVIKIPDQPGSLLVLFGTGKFLEPIDEADTSVQTFYGVVDNGANTVAGRSALLQQTILAQQSITLPDNTALNVRVTSENELLASHKGWYLDLLFSGTLQGERQITDSIARNNKIIFTTLIPSDDVCSFGGSGWLMELDVFNGQPLQQSPFDLNQDNVFSTADRVTYNGNNVVISGKQSSVGIIPTPGIVEAGDVEYKYTPGSSGSIENTVENPGTFGTGRQSWRQLR